jgi:hypothetical protein
MNLTQFLEIIRNMEPLPGREFKPHRYLALLAVLDIIESQENPQKEFYYNDYFKNYFTHYFDVYHRVNDGNKPFKPFFHLKNAGSSSGRNFGELWFLIPRQGRKVYFNNMRRGGFSEGELRENIEYAEIDQEIFNILSDKESGQESREIVRKEIEKCLTKGLQTKL